MQPPQIAMRTPLKSDAARGRSGADDFNPADQVVKGLTRGILTVCLLVWGVVGFVFWIPLLLRTMVLFSVALVHATFAKEGAARAGTMLRDAVNFYRRGFEMAIESVLGAPGDREAQPLTEREVNLGGILNEVAWAALIWYFLFLWLGVIQTTPLDAWRALAALPLLETLDSASISFAQFVHGLFPR